MNDTLMSTAICNGLAQGDTIPTSSTLGEIIPSSVSSATIQPTQLSHFKQIPKPLINYRLFNYMISGKNDLVYCNTYIISISWCSFKQWYVAYIHISKISINSSIHLFCCDVQYITDEKRQKRRHIGLLMVLIIKGKMHHIYLHILSYVYITYSVTTKQIKQKKSWHIKSVTIVLVRTCRLFGEGLYFIFFPITFALYYSRGCRIQLNILNVSPNTVKPYNIYIMRMW